MKLVYILISALLISACAKKESPIVVAEEVSLPADLSGLGLTKLSDYGFFKGPLKDLSPTDSVFPYALNSALFTDYAYKKRFIKFPKGTKAIYHATETLDFPNGTVLIKNFYYPADFRKPTENIRILETRLLIKEENGWKSLPYIWNDEQTEATLDVAGKNIPVQWTHYNGEVKQINYSVPNMNQCKSCHMRGQQIAPIGPSARQLNRPMEGSQENQLTFLAAHGKLDGLPELAQIPRLASYDDKQTSLDARARAWLEINCAHCHRPEGPAKTSGLHLLASTTDPMHLGVGKAPVAAGKGSGGLLYDIVPGEPEKSILFFRINSIDPGTMMPELGRSTVHEEGVTLIKEWIDSLESSKSPN
ncbi:MAG: SO2930 family diheme c-type cytochrome [Bacteroidota bacterium]